MRDFERPFTPQTWLRSASNFGKTHFRRFPTLHFLMPNICFWMCIWDLFVGLKKFTRNWKTAVFEELGSFWRHGQLRLEKWPPMKSFSGLYDIWRRGKRLRFDFWPHFSPKSDFHKKVIYVITKLRKIENHPFLRSYELSDVTGRCASKNDPRWNYFQVSTTSGGGVKDYVLSFGLTFHHKVTFTKLRFTWWRNCCVLDRSLFW